MTTVKSAIQEVRDQLFLDRADGRFLNVITENLGLSRPNFGFSNDDIWRAVVRRLALDTKQIENVFRDLLSIVFGPQYTLAVVLAQTAAVGDESIYVSNWMSIPQRGTLILDAELPTEESVEYLFRDPLTGEVTLDSVLTYNHAAPDQYTSSFLRSAASASDTTIAVRVIDNFPTSGFPYSLHIGAGTATEETVQLVGLSTGVGNGGSDNLAFSSPTVTMTIAAAAWPISLVGSKVEITGATDPDNNGIFVITGIPSSTTMTWANLNGAAEANFAGTWTVLDGLEISALTNAHAGPSVTFVTSGLSAVSPSGGVLTIENSENFPAEGYVRVQEDGGATIEDVDYIDNDPVTDRLQLRSNVGGTYTNAEVTLLQEGAKVELAQVKIDGIGWDIFQTDPLRLRIYIPESLNENRLQDAAFLHGTLPGATPTTVSGSHSIGDTILTVADASTFPSEGIILINSVEAIAYTLITEGTILYPSSTSGIPIGHGTTANPLYVENAAVIYAYRNITKELVIDIGGTPENVEWESIDLETNAIVLVSATTAGHATGDTVNLRNPGINDLRLSRGLASGYSGGESVAVIENAYGSTDLEDGRIFTVTDHLYQGSYLWTFLERIAETTSTALDGNVAGPTYLEVSQQAGRTALEVKDAALFLTSDFCEVRIGRGLAGVEDRQINDITLMRSVSGVTINGAALAGDLSVTVSGSSGLPEAWGYRLFIDDNVSGTDEEIVIVKSFSGTTVVLEEPLAYNHSVGDNVQLLADVLTIDALSYFHSGRVREYERTYLVPLIGTDWSSGTRNVVGIAYPRIAKIEEIRTYIDVDDASSFTSSGGYVQINFGRSLVDYESQLTSDETAGSGSIVVDDGSGYPTANFYIHVGEGTSIIETIECSSRTGNTLTLSSNLLFNHRAGEWVLYETGEQEQLVYTGTETGGANERLLFADGIILSQNHLDNEPVHLSGQRAIPTNTGTDFPVYFPSKWEDRIEFLIDLARAAGVRVTIISDR